MSFFSIYKLEIVETIAITMTIIFYISPIKMIINLYKTKDTRKTPFLLYIFTIFTCLSNAVYGVQIHAPPIWMTNLFGALLFVIFLAISIYYCTFSYNMKLSLIIGLYCYVIIHSFVSFNYFNQIINGKITIMSNILMNIAPLHQVYLTIKYNDVGYIDIWVATGLIISNYAWGHYGILLNMNMVIIIPSLSGVFCAALQCILWFVYKDANVLCEELYNVIDLPDGDKQGDKQNYKKVPSNDNHESSLDISTDILDSSSYERSQRTSKFKV